MELRDIEYFAMVAQHAHLGRAAEALKLSQPAVSKSLRRLEEAVGAKLGTRTPKGVELTPEGSALLLRVRGLRVSLQDVAREVRDVSEGRIGHLRVGVGENIAEYLLPTAFEKLLVDAPGVLLKITVSDNDLMFPALHNGEIDLVVNYLRRLPEGFAHEELYNDEMLVCASYRHPLTKRKRVSLSEIAGERWALTDSTLQPYQLLQEAFLSHGLPAPRAAIESRSLRLRFESLARSNLLDYTSKLAFLHSAWRYRLKEIPVPELRHPRPVGVIYRKNAYLSPATRRLIDILRDSAPRLKNR
jgi:DNA-binding transcriptional LysR family regulator